MRRKKQFEIEGAVLEVPLFYGRLAKLDVARSPDLFRHLVYIPDGYRVMETIADTCPRADLHPGVCQDCGACNFYRRQEDPPLGVCHREAIRRKAPPEGKGAAA